MIIFVTFGVPYGRRSEKFHDVVMKFSRRRNGFSQRRNIILERRNISFFYFFLFFLFTSDNQNGLNQTLR